MKTRRYLFRQRSVHFLFFLTPVALSIYGMLILKTMQISENYATGKNQGHQGAFTFHVQDSGIFEKIKYFCRFKVNIH